MSGKQTKTNPDLEPNEDGVIMLDEAYVMLPTGPFTFFRQHLASRTEKP